MRPGIILIFIIVHLFAAYLSAQSKVQKQVNRHRRVLTKMQKGISTFQKRTEQRDRQLSDSLNAKVKALKQEIDSIHDRQQKLVKETARTADSLSEQTVSRLGAYHQGVRKTIVVLGMLVALIITILVYLIFRVIRKDEEADQAITATLGVCSKISDAIREHDEKLEKMATAAPVAPPVQADAEPDAPAPSAAPAEIDHSFYLRVAEEIYRMRARINRMPKNTKGAAALSNAVKRLEDELIMKGYVVNDLTGLPYDDGMTAIVRDFIPQDDLPKGEKKILRTIKPQVKFRNNIINHGEIEVAMSTEDLAQQ